MGLHIGLLRDLKFDAWQPREEYGCLCQTICTPSGEYVLIACAEHAHARVGDFVYAVEIRQPTTDDQPMD